MIKKFNLKLIVFIIACLYSSILSAQINSTTAVVPFGANPSYANGIMPTNLPTGGTYGKSQDAANAYNTWKAGYAVACGSGYRIKFDDPTVTVSEGIGYGMLLAAYAADKAFFDGLWTYYKANANGNGFMNWRIAGCSGATGSNGATDADLDAAYALLVAQNQWPTATSPFNYQTEANAQIARLKNFDINSSTNYQAINGDGWGYSNQCRNPSYQAPAYYKQFNIATSDANWTSAVTGAYGLINKNANATTGLVSDWCDPNGTANSCNASPNGQTTVGYGYDACRNPWRMAQDVIWNNDASAKTICTNLAAYIATQGASNVKAPLYQNGSLYSGNVHNATFVSMFATAVMGSTNQTLMNQMYSETVLIQDPIQNQSLSGYFGNTLRCVSLFMMTGNFWKIGTTSKPNLTVLDPTLTAIPTGKNYDFQNVISSGTSSKTFTLKNLGFQTLTFTGSPVIVKSGTDATLFTLTQTSVPASLSSNGTATFTIQFTPGGALGTKTATFSIASNDPNQNPYTFTVTGTGTVNATAPIISVSAGSVVIPANGSYAMGTSSVGSNNIYGFTVSNSGTAPLNLTPTSVSGTGYSVVPPLVGSAIAVGATDTVWVQVTSATAGTPTGSITVNSDDPTYPAYKINLTATVVACGTAITTNNIYQDYDANYGNSSLDYTNTAWVEKYTNPSIDAVNPSLNVAKFARPATGTYNGVRYGLCSTTNFVTLTSTLYDIAVLVYSPVAGVPVTMNLKTDADVANTTTYPSTSSVTVTTTLVNQWEVLYFNHAGAIGKTGLRHIELFIDPQAAMGAKTYYVDKIQLVQAPCITDLPTSNILQDFDAHRNVSLSYTVSQYTEEFANPVSGGINTSSLVGKFVKNVAVTAYSDAFRYLGCGNKLTIPAAKPFISMLVYAPFAGANVQLNINTGVGTVTSVLSSTTKTVYANQWQKVYFDLSSVAARTDLTSFDVFLDPTNVGVNGTYYVDDIQFDVNPCAGFAASTIMDDFDNNRFLNLVNATGTYNDVVANPSKTGINTSTTVASYARPATGSYTNFILQPCSKQFDLSLGRSIYTMQVYSPKANVPVVMTLKNGTNAATATDLIQASDTVKTANTWVTLTFDFTDSTSSTNANFMYVYIDPAATNGATTYYVDNIQYAGATPVISVKQGSVAYKNGSTYLFATPVAIGATGSPVSFTIQNNGLQSLNLNSIKISNPEFVIDTTQTVRPVSAGSGTGFTITFTPTSGGIRTGTLTILSNDPLKNKNPYKIYLSATASSPVISVFNGATAVANNNTTAVSMGSAPVGTAVSPVFTFTIKNTGLAALTINSITASPGVFVASAITPTGDIAATTGSATFTVTATPAVAGLTTGTIVIKSNDPTTPTYTVNVTVTGTVPVITVKDATATVVANNNTTAVSVGSAPVGTAATAYTFTIANTGLAPLTIASITGSTGFAATAITPTGAIAASGSATFTVTGTPAASGLNTGTITIATNDPATPSYKVNVTVTGTLPAIQVLDGATAITTNNTPAISLGSAPVATAATAHTFTIKNTGLAPLTGVTVTGVTGFVVSALTPASTTIAAGASATFTVTGTPAIAGVNTGIITIVSNDPTTPSFKVNVTVTGTVPTLQVLDGTTPVVTNNTPAISVGSSVIATAATPYTFTLKNTGGASLTGVTVTGSTGFAVSALSPASTTIAAGASATFTVTGTPAIVGSNAGTITIASNDPTTPSYKVNVTVTGTAAATPTIQVLNGATNVANNNTPAISVGNATIGSAATAFTFTIKNTGAASLTGVALTSTTGFAVSALTPASTTIAAGASATFTVTGTPATGGVNTGSITIASNDPLTPSYKVNVSVTGNTPTIQVLDGSTSITTNNSPSISLGTASVGAAVAPYTITVKNTGLAPLTGVTLTGSTGFVVSALSPASTTIAAGASATFTITATPAAVGANAGTVTIASNDPTTPSFKVNVSVTGTAPLPAIQVLNGTTAITTNNTPAISVGSSVINTAASPYTITIKNNGLGDLTGVTVTGSTGFVVSALTPASTTIAAGASATFTVTGTPATVGTNTGTVTVASNDPTTPSFKVNVSVTGTAVATPTIQVLNGATNVANNNTPAISLGSSTIATAATPFTLTISNTGAADLTGVTVTGSTGFAVSALSPASTTIAAGASATFTVTGTPSTVGTNTGTVTIASNDPLTPSYKVNVSVTGTAAPTPALQVLNNATVLANNGTAISLGTTVVNTAGTPYTSFSIKNNGTAALSLTSITGTSVFAVSAITPAAPTSVAAGASVTFTVTGTPTTVGTNTGTIVIVTNDPTTPSFSLNVTMTATATPVPPTVTISGVTNGGTATDLGSAVTGSSTAPKTFTITNPGTTPLTNISITGSTGYTVSGAPTTIPAGGTATFTVTGTPTTDGANPGTITITSNDPNSPFVINVTSTGTAKPVGAAIEILDGTTVVANNGSPIAIGANAAGTSTSPYYFTIKNIGTLPLSITGVSGTSGFTVSQIIPVGDIAPGATALIKVSGTPLATSTQANPRVGYVLVHSNDVTAANQTFTINVSVFVGTPTGLPKTLASSAIDLYPNPSNGSATLQFNGSFDDVSVVVYKADGGQIYSDEMASVINRSQQLDLEQLPAGVYFVEVSTMQGKLVKRMIKQ